MLENSIGRGGQQRGADAIASKHPMRQRRRGSLQHWAKATGR